MVAKQNYFCIYCLQEKSRKHFNSEHVLLKAFGVFGTDTFTLINKVCIDCNQGFGNVIDNVLSRETLEGVHRFRYNVKDPKEFEYSKHAKNQTRIATNGFLEGFELKFSANQNGTGLAYNPNDNYDVAFKKEDESYDFYHIDDLPDAETLKQKYPQCLEEIKILNNANAEYIVNILSKLFNTEYSLEEGIHEGNCQVKAIYRKEVFRAIAKIAFNYLTYYFNDTSLMIQKCFHPIRDFIVRGIGEWDQFITIEKDPIIPDENGYAKDVHLLTLSTNSKSIFSSVSLHNKIHYKICLTSNYEGKSFAFGHCFDPHAHKIHKLGKSSLVLAKALPTSIQIVKPFIWLPS